MSIRLDPRNASAGDVYRLMISAIVPRPIAFISTTSPSGAVNLAPFSYFMPVSSQPAMLAVSIARKRDGSKKDTLRNIESNSEFVVNMVSESFAAQMHQTSAEYEYGVDEMARVGLTAIASERVQPPRVAESAVHFECRLHRLLEIGDGGAGSTTLIIGEIMLAHVDERVYREGGIDLRALAPVSRLGGNSYGKVGETFDIPRPQA